MIQINKKIIFDYKKAPIIIAEISGNHGGNKKKFLKLIDKAFSKKIIHKVVQNDCHRRSESPPEH